MAELLLFFLVLMSLGPKAAIITWTLHIIRVLTLSYLGVWVGMEFFFPFIPAAVVNFFDYIMVYAGGLLAITNIPQIMRDHAGGAPGKKHNA